MPGRAPEITAAYGLGFSSDVFAVGLVLLYALDGSHLAVGQPSGLSAQEASQFNLSQALSLLQSQDLFIAAADTYGCNAEVRFVPGLAPGLALEATQPRRCPHMQASIDVSCTPLLLYPISYGCFFGKVIKALLRPLWSERLRPRPARRCCRRKSLPTLPRVHCS